MQFNRVFFDIGEGIQRLCIEQKVKLGKLDQVCVTNILPSGTNGLPGYN